MKHLLLLCLITLMNGCGQTGALYLPTETNLDTATKPKT